MSVFKNELLLASAGTGKTYRLTNKFLSLLLAGVEPGRVLATTFTRKAAGEILDRVLERIVAAACGGAGLADLQSALDQGDLSAEQCRALLVKLTRGLDNFQVRTIDSFFAHLVRLFAHDLALPPNWSISDDREDQMLRSEAMRDVLENVDSAEMLELLRDIQKGGAGRGVEASLLGRADDLRSIYLESDAGAWDVLAVSAPVDEAAFDRARQALPGAPLAKTKAGLDMVNWVKARDKLIAAIGSEAWEEVFFNGLCAASLKEDPSYYTKPLSSELLEVLSPIVVRSKSELLNQLVGRNKAVYALLNRFETLYAMRKRDAGRLQFEDLPMALAPRTARAQLFDEREAELWFRLDGRIDHLLLDEFQDTSPVQWRILDPLASEIVSTSDERSFFCVGDAKQSIYGFRQAEPRLLENLPSLLPGLQAEFLDKSYRSSSVVLDLVNRVFADLASNAAFVGEDLEPHREAACAWSKRFGSHEAAKNLPGIVHVVEAREPHPDDPKGHAVRICAVERVARILEEAPEAEVGVLTRVNKNIPALIHALRARGIDASGEGGNALTDSEAVLVYISLLHLADHPSDSAAAFHVQTSRLAAYFDLDPKEDSKMAHEKARWFRGELLARGLGEVTAGFAKHIHEDPGWSAWDKTRFAQLAEQAYAFEQRHSLRASEFVDHLRQHRVEAPGGARVRVMTIHASKGLEFDAVVLPEMHSKLVGQRDTYLAERPEPTGMFEAVSLSPGKELLILSPKLESLYNSATARAVEDSLCSLYVAMTRAKRRLELILPWPDPEKDEAGKAPTYAAVLRAALPASEFVDGDSGGVIWRSPDNAMPDSWGEGLQGSEDETVEPEPQMVLAATTTPRFARRRSPSAEEGGTVVNASELLRSSTGANVGTLVHAAFEECEWVEDFAFEPAALAKHGADPAVVETAQGIIERALESDAIRAALSRETCTAPEGTELRVEREPEFSLFLEDAEGEPQFWNGAIDRLVLAEQGGRVVWAEVIDYKTDRVDEGELELRVDYYRPQLEAYARVVAKQTGLAPDQVKLRLAFVSMGKVIDV